MVFSVPSFTTIGDEFSKKAVRDERAHGLSFKAPAPKVGKLPDALFSKDGYQSIHEGDKYVDPGTQEKKDKVEKAKKKLTSNGFRYANPPKKSSGLGGYFGTFSESSPLPHETDYIVPRKGEAPPRKQPAPRPVYTNPPKAGTYGFPKTGLSDIGTEYIASFYNAEAAKDREDRERSRKLQQGVPFRAAARRGGTFDEQSGSGVSKVYTMTQPMPPRKKKPDQEKKSKPENPWKPGGGVLKFLPIPYREDPYDGYDPRAVPKAKKARDVDAKASWKPVSGQAKTWFTKSIAFARL